ncbi:MAG: quinone oxidoreductase [Alphaproteobacteria bacterium]|nr:quinone oxidoreductase [Alphaproteobacteria bacterium]|tara:strand:- start:724 stop:1701 length:978 start_codon:yes stop_codon:yes gene_type:complete
MANALVIHEPGPPEVMRWEGLEVGPPGMGEARVRHTAVGLNFLDCYFRSGIYPPPRLPLIVGKEAAGIVEAVADDVIDVSVGDRVVYATGDIGAYVEERNHPVEHLIPLPDDIDDLTAAAATLKGLTAEFMVFRSRDISPGEFVLVHAAAGGVGLILCQWLKNLGATVIGTAGTEEKADLARAAGCDHTVVYTRENVVERVRKITESEGVSVVFDSVGKDTFFSSLDCLRPLGLMLCYGQSSGPVPPFDMRELLTRQGLFLTRASMDVHANSRARRVEMAEHLFDAIRSGAVKIEINQTYALADAVQAHRDLEGRKTTGSSVLLV